VVVGDARLSLQARSERHDVIVLDAFSSDAIPIHLITREAVDLYLSRLNTDGVLAIHISNNYLDLRPVVAGVMRDLGLAGRVQYQPGASVESGRFGSHWAVLARSEAALGALAGDTRWARLRPRDERAWTDDFSNVWSVIQWRWR
jgi:spermidine synthase